MANTHRDLHVDCPAVYEVRQLLHALFSQGDHPPGGWSVSAWPKVAWLDYQSLASLVRVRFGKNIPLLEEELKLLQRLYWRDTIRSRLRTDQLHQVLQALRRERILPVVIKGAALAYTVYPDPACRPMSDIDLWIRPQEMAPARNALERIGYQHHVKDAGGVEYNLRYCGEIQMVPSPAKDARGVDLVELHSTLFPGEWLRCTARIEEQEIRDRIVAQHRDAQTIFYLAPEDELIQVAVHAAVNHQMSSPWLRTLADIVLLARKQSIHWDTLVSRCRDWQVAGPVGLVLKMAVEMAGLEEAAAAASRLLPPGLRYRQLERMRNLSSLVQMHDLTNGPARFLYQLLLVDRWPNALRLLRRSAWPEKAWLHARYEGQGAQKALRFKYWRRILRGKP